MTDNTVNDDVLLEAIRRRLLEEIERRGGENSSIVNNIYGGGGTVGGEGGLVGKMTGSSPKIDTEDEDAGQIDPGLFDYMVEISKRDVLGPEDERGKRETLGWNKTVRRFREPRGQDIERETKKKI